MELYNTEAWAERRRPSNKEWEANVNFREVLDLFFKHIEWDQRLGRTVT